MAGTKPPMKDGQSDSLAEGASTYTQKIIGDEIGVKVMAPGKIMLKKSKMTLTIENLQVCALYKDWIGRKFSSLNFRVVTYNNKAEKDIGEVGQKSTIG